MSVYGIMIQTLHYAAMQLRVDVSPARRQVSDSGLARLARVPQLWLVDVRGCFRVTASGAATARATAGGRLPVVTGSDAFDAIPAALLGHEPSVRAGSVPCRTASARTVALPVVDAVRKHWRRHVHMHIAHPLATPVVRCPCTLHHQSISATHGRPFTIH